MNATIRRYDYEMETQNKKGKAKPMKTLKENIRKDM